LRVAVDEEDEEDGFAGFAFSVNAFGGVAVSACGAVDKTGHFKAAFVIKKETAGAMAGGAFDG